MNIKKILTIILITLLIFWTSLIVFAANSFPTTVNTWSDGDIIESDWANALESKIGIDGSATTTSLDYLIKNSSSSTYTLDKTDGGFIVGDGSGWVLESGATARTSMGLGSIATETATDYLTLANYYSTTTWAGGTQALTVGGILTADGDLTFNDEIKPDGDTCSDGQILKKNVNDDWDCVYEEDDSTIDYFINNTAAGFEDTYTMKTSETGDVESSIASSTLPTGDDQLLFGFLSDVAASFHTIQAGTYHLHAQFEKTDGTRPTETYWTLTASSTDGTQTRLLTSETVTVTDVKTQFYIHAATSTAYTFTTGDKILLNIYANVGATGNAPEITIYMEGNDDAHLTILTPTSAILDLSVLVDGTNALSANWNAGSYYITATGFTGEASSTSQISTLTNTKWCSTDGTVITCTEEIPGAFATTTADYWGSQRAGNDISWSSGFNLDDPLTITGLTVTYSTTTGTMVIPTSASLPLVQSGQFGYDTTTGQLRIHDGTADRVLSTGLKAFTIGSLENPVAGDQIPNHFKAPYGMTITQVDCLLDPTDTTGIELDIDIFEADANGDSTTTIFNVPLTVKNTNTATSTFANATIDSGDWVGSYYSNASGTASWISCTVKYRITAD